MQGQRPPPARRLTFNLQAPGKFSSFIPVAVLN